MTTVDTALAIAMKAHEGQTRWDGSPYITHPKAVAEAVAHLGEEYEAVAWLHDVMEDSPLTGGDLLAGGIPLPLITSVLLLTRDSDQSYVNYILLLKHDPIAKAVKIADLKHNLSTSESPGKKNIRDKWLLALHLLENVP